MRNEFSIALMISTINVSLFMSVWCSKKSEPVDNVTMNSWEHFGEYNFVTTVQALWIRKNSKCN